MGIQKITISEFIQKPSETYILIDVRSPSEFSHAHIPFAINISLFNDEERKVVGTAYKQQTREIAIKIGLNFFGPKMVSIVEEVEQLLQLNKGDKDIVIHCWRGGMRSAAIAWLLDMYGFKVYLIVGGYKAYRNWVLKQFEITYQLNIIGGYTGSGKTEILAALKQKGEATIDLEGLAKHKGSSFGNLAEIVQPTQEMFENLLANDLQQNQQKCIWIEDESQRIGNVNIPIQFFAQKQMALTYFVDIPFESRLQFIVEIYGKHNQEKIMNGILRIKKRLGGLDTKNAINALIENDYKSCFSILLEYYDKQYLKGLAKKENPVASLHTLTFVKVDPFFNAEALLQFKNKN